MADLLDDAEPASIFAPALRSATLGLLIVITLIAFEEMAVSTALPTAARDLHGVGSYGFAFTGFLVANIVGMVASGRRSDRAGPAGPIAVGIVGFVIGLVLAGTATTMTQLIAGRVVQGLAGGLMITASYVVIAQAYSDRLRPKVFAATSSAWVVPSLVGPLIAGSLAQHVSWRWVFYGLVPFTLLGAALIAPVLRRLHGAAIRHEVEGGTTLPQAVAVAVGVGALGLIAEHPSVPWLCTLPVWVVLAGWGLRALLPRGTFVVRPGVPAPIALRGLLAGSFFGVESLVPLSLTVQHHFGATAAGLPLAVSGLSWATGSFWQGRAVADDSTARRVALMRAGFSCVTLALVGMAVTALPSSPGWPAYPSWLVGGLGMGLTMSSLSVTLLRFSSPARHGADAGALQLADATGSALTTAVGGMAVAGAARGVLGYTSAFVAVDLTMAAIALLGLLVAGRARPAVPVDTATPVEPLAA
ncbi:MFS transporter [Jatrophihabitans endophyticus]|uniref:MFS transporter n=1 Tax=Jatrophihabitans endophyticus TaxID=1206085 RepID=UPI001A03BF69|nr:MFS transporter [Jatrophihabitans endophyticus]MBE7188891.1 MFS transporter [Jatrophihabitans endophyticus]